MHASVDIAEYILLAVHVTCFVTANMQHSVYMYKRINISSSNMHVYVYNSTFFNESGHCSVSVCLKINHKMRPSEQCYCHCIKCKILINLYYYQSVIFKCIFTNKSPFHHDHFLYLHFYHALSPHLPLHYYYLLQT